MKLNNADRADFFGVARAVSPLLGDLFQNHMELTTEIIQKEIDETRSLKKIETDRYDTYIWKLGELLCFPENFKP